MTLPAVSSGMTETRPGWTPALVRALRDYSWSLFGYDVVAGLTVGLVALPLAMAFAIASGLKPEQGI
jgi:SulP family sulfate permease